MAQVPHLSPIPGPATSLFTQWYLSPTHRHRRICSRLRQSCHPLPGSAQH